MTKTQIANEIAAQYVAVQKMSLSDLLSKHTAFDTFAAYAETQAKNNYAMTIRFNVDARSKRDIREAAEKQVLAERLASQGYPLYLNGKAINY